MVFFRIYSLPIPFHVNNSPAMDLSIFESLIELANMTVFVIFKFPFTISMMEDAGKASARSPQKRQRPENRFLADTQGVPVSVGKQALCMASEIRDGGHVPADQALIGQMHRLSYLPEWPLSTRGFPSRQWQ